MVEDAVSMSKEELEDMIECMSKHFPEKQRKGSGDKSRADET